MSISRKYDILQNLKAILRRRGLSQRDFAILLDKKESEISRWLSGKVCISRLNQIKIEKALCEPISVDSTYRISTGVVKIGLIGTGNIARRFASEMPYVTNGEIVAAYDSDKVQLEKFCREYSNISLSESIDQLIESVDAVYIASPVSTHAAYAKACLLNSKHVLCEMPFTISKEDAKVLYEIAVKKGCVLMPALKTAYCPSFIQMNGIAQSGIIGDIVDITACVTTLLPDNSPVEYYNERLLENATYPLLSIFKIFGTNFKKLRIFCKRNGDKIDFSQICLEYEKTVATFKIGVGVKSEGSLVVSGTKGYIYVPAPWWKTDYFEVRFENQNDNKKYFFPYESSGLRYEIQAFVDSINKSSLVKEYLTQKENLKILEIQNKILTNGK